jgi:hypothetical protein
MSITAASIVMMQTVRFAIDINHTHPYILLIIRGDALQKQHLSVSLNI